MSKGLGGVANLLNKPGLLQQVKESSGAKTDTSHYPSEMLDLERAAETGGEVTPTAGSEGGVAATPPAAPVVTPNASVTAAPATSKNDEADESEAPAASGGTRTMTLKLPKEVIKSLHRVAFARSEADDKCYGAASIGREGIELLVQILNAPNSNAASRAATTYWHRHVEPYLTK